MFNIWKDILNNQGQNVANLLDKSQNIATEYDTSKEDKSEIGFNLFKIASDTYYRENFHSDVIKSFLDPSEKHSESNRYLHAFIDLLNEDSNKNRIEKSLYLNSKVIRESKNIDILILDEVSKRAIIIENKINNAYDMPRQIPRYFNLIKNDYKVDGIVYLTINKSKRPDTIDWTDDEIVEIKKILRVIPSYDRNGLTNLYENWLINCLELSENVDNKAIIKQYANLIKHLSTNYMDTISLEKFYNTVKEGDNLKTSLSIRNMLNDLPTYLAVRIEDRYRNNCYPFEKVWRYKERDTVFEAFKKDSIYLKIDIWCSELGYRIHFWNPHNEQFNIFEEFNDWHALQMFSSHNNQINNVIRDFSIYEESSLFEVIDNLLICLKNFKEQISTISPVI
ncbi:PD-(D/E)XK nuclease family protein [Sphingobacterium tabacisoli]|uniref:PD-(D/E)XK nuclease family protein n=1 Tax=Sphingobacterium tabacisoli TaxID=2044855 RepID=A0ABW5L6B5_9SPHI|nr:PD-(D/E)XK nuclease family protein [Sphingobacterium tabacisoli]